MEYLHSAIRRTELSGELKNKCAEAVMEGEGSVNGITARYGLSGRSVLIQWLKMYKASRDLEDYNPKQEVCMAEARRKTTFEERKEIAGYCISPNRDDRNTAAKYDVSCSRLCSRVKNMMLMEKPV